MKGLAVIICDTNQNILQVKKIDFPEYNFKELSGFNFKKKQELVNYISKTDKGNYIIHCTNTACRLENYDWYPSIGFSYLELDSTLKLVKSVFYPFENLDDYENAMYSTTRADKKTIIFSSVKKGKGKLEISSESLSFVDEPKPLLKKYFSMTVEGYVWQNIPQGRRAPLEYQFL